MNAMRWVLPVLVAVTMIVGDCSESQARCRLFGRRRARQCCPAPCPATYPAVKSLTASTTICPLYETMYDMGNNYRMFYSGEQSNTTPPSCGANPQPAYLPRGTAVGCGGNTCWTINPPPTGEPHAPPDNQADHGHSLSGPPGWAMRPRRQYKIDFDPGAGESIRNISFHWIWMWVWLQEPDTGRWYRIRWEVPLAFEDPDADFPETAVPESLESWSGHSKGYEIKLKRADDPVGLTYWVILAEDPMP